MSGVAYKKANGRGREEAKMCECCRAEVVVKMCSGCHSVYNYNMKCQKWHWTGRHKQESAQLGKVYADQKTTSAGYKSQDCPFEEVRRQLEESLQVLREHAGREGRIGGVEKTISCAGNISCNEGKNGQTLEKLTEGLEISRTERENDHEDVAEALYNVAYTYLDQDRFDLALRKFQQALEVETYLAMGRAYHQLGQPDKALEYLYKALDIKLNALGSDHFEVASTQFAIARVHYDQGSYARAKELFEECAKVFFRVYGADHDLTKDAIAQTSLAGVRLM